MVDHRFCPRSLGNAQGFFKRVLWEITFDFALQACFFGGGDGALGHRPTLLSEYKPNTGINLQSKHVLADR